MFKIYITDNALKFGLKYNDDVIIEANKYSYLSAIEDNLLFKHKICLFAKYNDKFGIIDYNDNIILSFDYKNIFDYHKYGFLGVTLDDIYFSLLDLNGIILSDYILSYDQISDEEYSKLFFNNAQRNLKLKLLC
jgi:hypothetical protein